jgi:excisionase family DNA binding protein
MRRFHTVPEAAKILRVTQSHLRKLIREGALPAIRLGPKTVRIPGKVLRNLAAPTAEEPK